jgi:uncharacterized protein involved in exopolysaccharide biosynthesis
MDRNTKPSNDFDLSAISLPWQDLIRSLFRHRKLVFAILAIGFLGAVVQAWSLPPTYKARSVLIVKDARARVAVTPDAETRTVLDRVGDAQVNALATLLRDANTVREALTRLREKAAKENEVNSQAADAAAGSAATEPAAIELDEADVIAEVPAPSFNPLALPAELYRRMHQIPEPSELDQRAQQLAIQVRVEPVWKTSLIEVSFISGDPHWSANFVNALSETLIDKYRSLYESTTTQEFFHGQRIVLAQKLEQAQAARAEFRRRVGAELLTLNPEELRLRIAELEQALDHARTERSERVAHASTSEVDVGSNPALSSLKQRILGLEIERSELMSRYTETSVAVRDIDRQLAEAHRMVEKERRATIEMQRDAAQFAIGGIEARITTITSQIGAHRQKLNELEIVGPEWEGLENEVASAKEAYRTYSRKEEQARFSNALDESDIVNVAIVENAKPPTEPESSPMKRLIVLGTAMSALAGLGLALLRDWLDPTVKTTMQVERLTGLPVLGEILT